MILYGRLGLCLNGIGWRVSPEKTVFPLVPKDIESSESLANKQARQAWDMSPLGSPGLSTSLGSPPGGTCWGRRMFPLTSTWSVPSSMLRSLHIVQLTNHPVGQVLWIPNLEMGGGSSLTRRKPVPGAQGRSWQSCPWNSVLREPSPCSQTPAEVSVGSLPSWTRLCLK